MRRSSLFAIATALATAASCQRGSDCADCLGDLAITIAEASGARFPDGSYRFTTDQSPDGGTVFDVDTDSDVAFEVSGTGSMRASPSGTAIVVSGLSPYRAARFAVYRRLRPDAGVLVTQERLIGEADYHPDPGLGPERLSCGPCPHEAMTMLVDAPIVDGGDE